MLGTCLENVRNTVPLVHNITNYVTVNDVANILLACGGSPIMSDEPEDVEDITSICGGLNINIGTLNQRSIEGMFRAGAKANALGHVVLLDPVGAGASALRTNTAVELMEKIKFTVIRGNISEIKTLALGSGTTKGVDADVADAVTDANLDSAVKFVKDFAAKSGAIVAVTGAIDLVSDGTACYVIRNGRPEMGKITGTGCQLSGMMTAFVVANPDNKLEAAAAMLREKNPDAAILTTPWDELDGKTILSAIEKVSLSDELLEKMRREHEIEEAEHEHEHHHHHDHDEHDEHDEHEHHHHHHDGEECDDPECECHHHHHHHADDVFSSWGKETPKKFSKEALEDMLHKLDSGDYGHILRAKGIVNGEDGWLEFDYVPEEHEVRAGHPDYTGRLCVIGAELKEDGLAELFGV